MLIETDCFSQLELSSLNNEFGVRVASLTGDIGRAACKRHFVKRNSQQGIPKEVRDCCGLCFVRKECSLARSRVSKAMRPRLPARDLWVMLWMGLLTLIHLRSHLCQYLELYEGYVNRVSTSNRPASEIWNELLNKCVLYFAFVNI
jgi:hypothetical protein